LDEMSVCMQNKKMETDEKIHDLQSEIQKLVENLTVRHDISAEIIFVIIFNVYFKTFCLVPNRGFQRSAR